LTGNNPGLSNEMAENEIQVTLLGIHMLALLKKMDQIGCITGYCVEGERATFVQIN
jgi:hypothetical protein